MSTYNIDFTDPLRAGFQIAAGSFNGPGSTTPASALKLYGRGALEWGEAVDEDLLRAQENWNSSTPPPYPIAGQLWYQTKSYWLDNTAADPDGPAWYRYDPDTPDTWTSFTVLYGGTTGIDTAPLSPAVGSYWYTDAGPFTPSTDAFGNAIEINTLYLFWQAFPPQAAGWMKRSHVVDSVKPVDGVFGVGNHPETNLLVWDEFSATFIAPPISVEDLGGILADGTVPMTGPLDAGSFKIINLDEPTLGTDAATKNYVDINFLGLGGGTMTGDLVLSGGAPAGPTSATPKSYVDGLISGLSSIYLALAGGTMAGGINMNSNTLTNVPTPAGTGDASNKAYTDKGLRPVTGTPTAPKYTFSLVGPSGGSDGDIWFRYV